MRTKPESSLRWRTCPSHATHWVSWSIPAWVDAFFWQVILSTFVLILLSGCAGTQAFKDGNALLAEGKTEQGLAKLEEAVQLDPKNAEYRIALATRRASIISRLIANGETARREGRLSDAEKSYRQVQSLEAENAMARQGLEALAKARRHQLVLILFPFR